ncbi:MAG TPA: cytochrome c oxidase subunit II [Solirubrobacterales bacterium]|jgi:cytochrome c oxidase subunit 2
MNEANHMRRIAVAWFVLSAILTPIVVVVIAPTLPPGKATNASSSQVFDNTVLFGILTPIAVAIAVYFAYALVVFRHRGAEPEEGVATRDNPAVHVPWLATTSVIVLFLAAFGTIELADAGVGGGQGPSPVFKPSGSVLPVQVIGQQWEFTYRYPTYGGVETPHIELPVGRQIALHVTSLDVIHSFWAPRLGVKVDANPGVDNVAFVKPEEERSFELRCSELCGLWHGYMFDTGQVVGESAFREWIQEQRRIFAPATRVLPKYSTHYIPEPERRGG